MTTVVVVVVAMTMLVVARRIDAAALEAGGGVNVTTNVVDNSHHRISPVLNQSTSSTDDVERLQYLRAERRADIITQRLPDMKVR